MSAANYARGKFILGRGGRHDACHHGRPTVRDNLRATGVFGAKFIQRILAAITPEYVIDNAHAAPFLKSVLMAKYHAAVMFNDELYGTGSLQTKNIEIMLGLK
eukprot:m.237707 g.237707  ORF g.237707 m.237707 type:complete len:103 (+) comp26219_c1_seq3:3869-4177(+)